MPTDLLIHPEIERYIDAMWMEKGLSDNSLSSYRRDLRQFHEWLAKERDSSITRADRSSLQAYLGARLQQGQSPRSTARFMSCVRGFYHYLLREGRITVDPTLDVDSPKLGRPLPKSLSEAEVDRLLQAPDLDVALEFRDRTMLELLYACGLRVTELTSLQLGQVSVNQGVVRVFRQGQQGAAGADGGGGAAVVAPVYGGAAGGVTAGNSLRCGVSQPPGAPNDSPDLLVSY